MYKRLRSNLLTTYAYLKPQVPEQKANADLWKKRKKDQINYNDSRARRKQCFCEKIPGNQWKPAVVISEALAPRSFL